MAKNNLSMIDQNTQNKILHYQKTIEYLEALNLVVEDEYHERIKLKLSKMESEKSRQIESLDVNYLTLEAYVDKRSLMMIDALNKKFSLKEKAIKQAMIRHHNQKRMEEALQILNQQKVTKINKIKSKYTRFYKEKNNQNLTEENYQTLLAKIEDEFKQKSQLIVSNEKNKVSLQLNKIAKKILMFESKLEKLRTSFTDKNEQVDAGNILEIKHLTMKFGGLTAVSDLSFSIKEGEIFGLIGPNGAGKTTVFNCITQFYKPTSGNVLFRDLSSNTISLNNYKVHEVIKHGIARTFQNIELIWELSVLDNLLVGSHSMYQSTFFDHLFHTTKFKREEKVLKKKAEKILTDLGIAHYMHFYPLGLPYGVLKTIEFARTLMTNPKLIILDEPAAGLNDTETEVLARTIKKIKEEYHTTIFLVEHDMNLVMNICDNICAISFGKMIALGKPQEIQQNKAVQEAYLGGE